MFCTHGISTIFPLISTVFHPQREGIQTFCTQNGGQNHCLITSIDFYQVLPVSRNFVKLDKFYQVTKFITAKTW